MPHFPSNNVSYYYYFFDIVNADMVDWNQTYIYRENKVYLLRSYAFLPVFGPNKEISNVVVFPENCFKISLHEKGDYRPVL